MKIYDAVHGFIHFNELESALIDIEVFQRLHYIHQLGIAYMIYPGAHHTRFEHSLGTMHLATKIFDQIAPDSDREYWRQMVRLAALCHDLGHLPFSHAAEEHLLGPKGHEEWTLKIIESSYLKPIWEKVRGEHPNRPVVEHIVKLSIGEEKLKQLRPDVSFSSSERIYAEVITGDFFGADRIDYLLRDAKATGLSYGTFDYAQLIEMLAIFPDEVGELQLGIEENGIESCEALLLARHFMQRRVYQYPAAKAYSFHLARFMKILYKDPRHFSSIENYLSMSEPAIVCALQSARKDPSHPGHLDAFCLFDRKQRFKAISISAQTSNSYLSSFKEKNCIPDSQIQWELGAKHSFKTTLSLPILRKNTQVARAEQYSQISIPPDNKNWLYLYPEHYKAWGITPECTFTI